MERGVTGTVSATKTQRHKATLRVPGVTSGLSDLVAFESRKPRSANTMAFSTDTLGLNDSAFALLRDLIHERTGLYYGTGKNDVLADKLSTLVIERGFN